VKLSDLPPNIRIAAAAQLSKGRHRPKTTEAEKAARRAKARMAQMAFFGALRYGGVPAPEAEYRFHDVRQWRFDYCWPDRKVALEVDGGLYTGGRHSRGAGMEKDQEKLNFAAALGWRVLRTTPRKLTRLPTIALIRMALEWEP
jgi:very-short-patch-repair endonuclease